MPHPALPVAQRGNYSVLLADLAGDKEEQMITNIADSLNGLEGVVCRPSQERPLPVDKASQTLSKVQQYLDETGFDVLIWGGVLRHNERSVPKLFLGHAAVGREEQRSVRQGRYALADQTFELPELFWSNLQFSSSRLPKRFERGLRVRYVQGRPLTAGYRKNRAAYRFLRFFSVVGRHPRRDMGIPRGFLRRARRPDRSRGVAATRNRRLSRGAQGMDPRVECRSTGPRRRTTSALPFRLLGERRWDEGKLEEAVAAYQGALKEWTRERVPLGWASTQHNLGTTLSTLGKRLRGEGKLEEAVAAFHEALKEFTRERVPLDWAMTQNNLGTASFDTWPIAARG